jgi:hypothetical protein
MVLKLSELHILYFVMDIKGNKTKDTVVAIVKTIVSNPVQVTESCFLI